MAETDVSKYLINYTDLAKKGELGELVGREKELERLLHILLRTTKNNPLVVGIPGVGKSALVYGLTTFMASEGAPEFLQIKTVVGLDVAAIMLASKTEEDYAETVKRTLQIVVDNPDAYLLYLKDISFLVNMDTNPENKEPAKFLKLSLMSGKLNCIVESDTSNFVAYMEKDHSVMSHMQTLFLEEPTVEESIQIAGNIKHTFEDHYGVIIPPETVKIACQLSHRYVKQRAFPSKALDLLDDSASLLMMDMAKGLIDPSKNIVEPEYCNRTIAEWTGIPVEKVDAEDKQRLANAEKYLKERVIGQDNAVVVVANAIRRARSGLQDPNRPIGSFLFIGTTGVGKTELAKSLADFMFNDETALLRLDMSEYMERSAVARMVGPAPGQPGYEQGGYLTESVRLKPFQVVLFDEIEKAHPDIMNLMLQLLDEGRLTDGKGITVDFRNTIIILTSNVGANLPAYQRVDALTQYFRPEFINRLDDVVSFHQLNEEHLRLIVDIHLNKLLKRAKNLGYSIVVDDSAKDWFVDEIFTSKFGVRALKRLIQEQVENRLSFLIMQEKVKPGQEVFLNVHPGGRRLQIYTKTVQTTVREEIAPVEFPNEPQEEEMTTPPETQPTIQAQAETEEIASTDMPSEPQKIADQPQLLEDMPPQQPIPAEQTSDTIQPAPQMPTAN
ncbi:MAG: AAA family ATPase [Alphaproteobacteria bacterium]|nr:AAA family ATPase [Alphaproteobacteria bacterium]